jgi:hypothetical protein
MKKHLAVLAAALILMAGGCNNFFHDLVPPDGDRIETFTVQGQLEKAVIGDTSITVLVPPSADLSSFIPQIQVSPKASLIPVTRGYIQRAFPQANIFQEVLGFYTSSDMSSYVIDLIKRNPGFNVPSLTEAIDFSVPVTFLVISARGSIREYTVTVEVDTGEGKFISFGFAKYDNPEITRNAVGTIDNGARTVTVNVLYPMDYDASYELVPQFETNGAVLRLSGSEIQSGLSALAFNPAAPNPQELLLDLERPGYSAVPYTLRVTFSEDPNTNRSITDFRFTKEKNPLISYTVTAVITDSVDTGTIAVTVYYAGSAPVDLIASFVSPGTVSVEGVNQTSGVDPQDFSGPLYYKVVSKDLNYIRTYRVTVSLVSAVDPKPKIENFLLTTLRNSSLISNSSAMIDHEAGLIIIEAVYGGNTIPSTLRPEFAAGGTVTVSGIAQTSGVSLQNFSTRIKYTVTDPGVPTLKRDYWVDISFVKNSASIAEITAFRLYKADNLDLAADATGSINQAAGTITITALFLNPHTAPRNLTVRWTAQGAVSVGGLAVANGEGSRNFDDPVTYRVTSMDGSLHRDYTVNVREINTRIYVKETATGRNSGVNWENAFTSLKDACDTAALFANNIPREVWIAEGTYSPSVTRNKDEYFKVLPNTSYIGGFEGTEAAKADRSPTLHPVTITGKLGGEVYSEHLFMNTSLGNYNAAIEDMHLTKAYALTGGSGKFDGPAIYVRSSGTANITIRGVDIEDTIAYGAGGAIYVAASSGSITISNVNIQNTRAPDWGGGAIYVISSSGSISISDTDIQDTQANVAGAICVTSSSGSVYISGCTIKGAQSHTIAGGIIAVDRLIITVTNSTFIDCRASAGNGGGIYCGIGSTISGNTYTNCTPQDVYYY